MRTWKYGSLDCFLSKFARFSLVGYMLMSRRYGRLVDDDREIIGYNTA